MKNETLHTLFAQYSYCKYTEKLVTEEEKDGRIIKIK